MGKRSDYFMILGGQSADLFISDVIYVTTCELQTSRRYFTPGFFINCIKENFSLKYAELNPKKFSHSFVGAISWSFVTTINRRPVTGMNPDQFGHHMANRKDTDLE